MQVLIKIENNKVKVILIDNGGEADFAEIKNEYQLSKELLPVIDKLIKRNKLNPKNVKRIKVDSDQSDSFTTARIAKSAANVWNYSGALTKFKPSI